MPVSPMSAVAGSASTIASEEVSGWHVLTVEQYTRTKNLCCGKAFCSNTFSEAGHRWFIGYYPNGINSYTTDSIYFHIYLRLEQTTSEVKAQITMSLLDLKGNPVPAHTQRSSCIVSIRCAETEIQSMSIKKKALEQSGCLFNDSFRIRCDITVFKVANKTNTAKAMKSFVMVPPSDIDRHLGHLLWNKEGVDLKLEVGGEIFPAHRSILAARSPVFKKQLFGPMKENTEVYMWIEGIEARVFKAFLHFVYNDSLPEIEEGEAMVMAQHLLVAADRYGMERLKLICEEKLCHYLDRSSVGTIVALAEQHGCHGLKKACLEFLLSGNNLKEAMATDGFHHLSKSCPSVLMDLLGKLAP